MHDATTCSKERFLNKTFISSPLETPLINPKPKGAWVPLREGRLASTLLKGSSHTHQGGSSTENSI